MKDQCLSCGSPALNNAAQSWNPIFSDHCNENFKIEMSESADINFGSSVIPIIGTTNDYALSDNKPSINGVTLMGNKTNEDINIGAMSNMDIENVLNSFT